MQVLGIDIGGSGIKGAPVDTETGELLKGRYRLETPQPSTPKAVASTVHAIIEHFQWTGPIGCCFPAVVQHGVMKTAANVDKKWIGTNGHELFEKVTGRSMALLNDADAAGIAEMQFGAGQGVEGTVLMLTLGTGIGSALFTDGVLMPNTELGHLIIRGKDAEERASARAREDKKLSWKRWGKLVDEYIDYAESLLWPDLIIIGGGVSKQSDKFFHHIKSRAPLKAAEFENEAGIVGAALAAAGKGHV